MKLLTWDIFGIKIKRSNVMVRYYLDDNAVLLGCSFDPPREGDVGYDIYAAQDAYLYGLDYRNNGTNHRAKISTGLHLEIPEGYMGLIKDRSSMADKAISVHAGVIDTSYRGEIKVKLQNNHHGGYQIKAGERIAQMIFVPVGIFPLEEVFSKEELSETERGDKGFGSTGK
jgi:dUTP pyrophosphatase